jgi:hypothetical protein
MIGQLIYSQIHRGTIYTQGVSTYALCNGQGLSRASYPALSEVWPDGEYGSTPTTIVLPNLNDYAARGWDSDRGINADFGTRFAPSGVSPSGATLGSVQIAAMATHVHVSGTGSPFGIGNSGPGGNQRPPATTINTSDAQLLPGGSTYTDLTPGGSSAFDVAHYKVYPYICVASA